MKKIINFIRNKMWIFILLNLLLGSFLTVVSEHAIFLGFSTAISLIMYSLSTKATNALKKYNLENKTLTHFIITTIVFILTAILVILDQFVFKLDLFSHIFGGISITLYAIIITLSVLFSRKSKFKLKFLFKSIKYLLTSVLGYILAAALLETGYYLNDYYSVEEYMIVIIVFYIIFLTSPLFEAILEKFNKGLGKIKRFLVGLIPISIMLFSYVLYNDFFDINETIIYIINIGTPLVTLLLFMLFTKRKYNEVKKIGFFKSLLIKTIIILLEVFIILFGIKIVFVVSYNRNNEEWITELKEYKRETIKLEPRELKEDETYLATKNIKIKNVFENVNVTNDYEEGSSAFIDIDGKGAMISYYNYTWEDVEYGSVFESIYFRNINSNYDYIKFMYDNSKADKLSILDSIKTIYATYTGVIYLGSEKINEIRIGDYIGFISKVKTDRNIYSISLFDSKNINNEYGITLLGYEENEVLDILSTIKIEERNNINLDLYKNANIKDYTSLSIYDVEEDLNYNYKCLDDIEENETCKNATISINNKEYNIGKLHLLKNDSNYILVNNYEGYSTLQIIDKFGNEILNIKFQELVKQNDVYIPYSLRYDEETENLYYYELINNEYIYKTLDLNTFKVEKIK